MSPSTSRPKAKRVEQRVAEAMEFQRSGNLAEAERLLRKAVDSDPTHAQAHHALAMMLHRRGQPGEALELMRRAAGGRGADASLFNNLGNMLREAGSREEAVAAYRNALSHDDNNLNTHFNLAGLLLDNGDAAGAAAGYERVLIAAPRDVGVRINLARALLALGQVDEAIAHLERACELAPDDPGCFNVRVQALLSSQRLPDGLALARASAARWPDNVEVAHTLIATQLVSEDYEGAEQASRILLAQDPDDVEALVALTRALLGQWRTEEAVALCDSFIASHPDLPDGYSSRGIALKNAGRLDEAVASIEQALAIAPGYSAAWSNLGQTWVDIGDVTRAQEALNRSLELDPHQPEALFNVVNTRRNAPEHREQIEHMVKLAETWQLNVDERLTLNFGLGKAFDDLGDYDRAFHHYRCGNELKRLTVSFLPEQFLGWAQGFHDTFDAEFFERSQDSGVASQRPVFIVGVPRSGTSLVEQILASHPAVYGAGELTKLSTLAYSLAERLGVTAEYPRSASRLDRETAKACGEAYLGHLATLDAHASRVTDKMPSNYFHLGLIAAFLPGARIIHCRRHPMDACFSNYIQLFGDQHYYSYSLEHIAVYYREYERIMEHWRSVLPLSMHTVSYEAMVEDAEGQTRELLNFLELPWDDACLEFHNTRRPVRTASHWQVRQPIYRSARQRWRRYESHLRGLAAAIGYVDGDGI